jgi:endonuclease/exonuclease/phosphatase family metal-dependent hydrolase
MYLRHPLVDRSAWTGLEERARAAGLDRKRGNTTWDYLNYLAGLGWLTPFKDYLASRTIEANPARAWRRLEDVDPRGLPESVNQRRKLVEESVSKGGEARAFSDVGGLQPFTSKDRFRSEVPPAGLFGAMGLDRERQRDPFARVVNSLRGRRAFADIVTWNVEHLHAARNRDKIPAVAELIRSFRCDFWAIQEADEESLGELVEDINSGGRIRYDFLSVPGRGQQNGCLFRTDTTSVRELDADPDRFSGRLRVEKRNGETVSKAVFHRKPLLVEARVSHGSERIYDFRTAVVHLKSTDSSLGDTGSSLRKAAARALAEWIHEDQEETGERDYLILGDMNAETARQGLSPFRDGLSLLSVGMQERYGEETALTRVASRRMLDHIVVTDDAAVLIPDQDENEQIIIRSDRVLQNFTSELSDHVPVAVRMVINVDDD